MPWPGCRLALVIGAMTDFEYFLRLDTVSKVTHTLPGLAYGCVPLGLARIVVWQAVIRDPSLRATPTVVRDRVGHLSSSGVPHTVDVARGGSVCTDRRGHAPALGFVHPSRLSACAVARLTASSPVLGLPWTSVLQRTSDLAGVIVLVVVIARLPRRPVQGSHHPWRFWLVTAHHPRARGRSHAAATRLAAVVHSGCHVHRRRPAGAVRRCVVRAAAPAIQRAGRYHGN